jgi:hypothetical protein
MSGPAEAIHDSGELDESAREIHLESLLGKRLRDEDGHSLGRIEELVAERRGLDWVVVEVEVGPGALLARLLEIATLVPLPGMLWRSIPRYRVGWHQVDLSDLDHPLLRVRRNEVERIHGRSAPG